MDINRFSIRVASMHILEISLFGSVNIFLNPGASEIRLTRIIQSMFAYLLIRRNRTHPREVLANLFWGESSSEHARGCLNTALWRLRLALEPEGTPPGTFLLINQVGEVGFNPLSDYWLDVAEFEHQMNSLLSQPVESISPDLIQAAERSLDLYRGDLLDGYYDDWALRERERLRFLYLNGLSCLMRHYNHQRMYEKGLVCGQRILAMDPLREEIHREMIRMYLASGQRSLAIHQFDYCSQVLAEELNIAPMEETQALFERVIAAPAVSSASLPLSDPQTLQQLRAQLDKTFQTINSAREEMIQMMQAVDNLLERK